MAVFPGGKRASIVWRYSGPPPCVQFFRVSIPPAKDEINVPIALSAFRDNHNGFNSFGA